jgi:hypothetical protein
MIDPQFVAGMAAGVAITTLVVLFCWHLPEWLKRPTGEGQAITALRDLIGMVDQMDVRPSAGGGVLPTDKARIMHQARKAVGL